MDWEELQSYAYTLLIRFDDRKKENVSNITTFQLPKLSQEIVFAQQPPRKGRRNPLKTLDCQLTIANLSKKFRLQPPENQYRSVKEKQIVRDVGDTITGIVKITFFGSC